MEKGAYIYLDEEDNIDLFLFKKCSYSDLKIALPVSFSLGDIEDNHDCINCIIHKGRDYLSSGQIKYALDLIEKKNMEDIINNDLEMLKNKGFINLNSTTYNQLRKFSIDQLSF